MSRANLKHVDPNESKLSMLNDAEGQVIKDEELYTTDQYLYVFMVFFGEANAKHIQESTLDSRKYIHLILLNLILQFLPFKCIVL